MLSREQLQQAAADSGFQVESYEQAHVLVRLLEAVRTHPFLGTRMALKGGTALNLFVLDFPRLSVDIDLNYVGSSDRATMLAERPRTDSHPVGGDKATRVLVLDEHELAAGKLAALVARSASRDVFDARELLRRPGLDPAKLRLGFVVYGGMNREDWRAITVNQIQTTAGDVDSQLVPMLRLDVRPTKSDIAAWTETLVRETRELMAAVLPLAKHELEFLERLNGAGDIVPEVLTAVPAMQAIIRDHPGLKWKALNVKKRLGGVADDEEPPA